MHLQRAGKGDFVGRCIVKKARRKQVFLSAVSDEFGTYRKSLKQTLETAGYVVDTQEIFGTFGKTTLKKVYDYIEGCNTVIHLVGNATGAAPPAKAVKDLLESHPNLLSSIPGLEDAGPRVLNAITYTQWEAYFAIHFGIELLIYEAKTNAARNKKFQLYDDARKERELHLQQQHLQRLCDKGLGHDRGSFKNSADLEKAIIVNLNHEYRQTASANVPSLPEHYVEFPERIEEAVGKLLSGTGALLGVVSEEMPGIKEKMGIHGMGGIGKTVLATALVHDKRVRKFFDNRIIWIKLGQDVTDAKLLRFQAEVYGHLTGENRNFEDTQHGELELGKHFQTDRTLLVLDDVWKAEHVKAFGVRPDSRLLFTTQQAKIIRVYQAQEQRLDVLGRDEALALLASASGLSLADLPAEAADVAEACGYLPLALAIAGKMVREDITWKYVLNRLKAVDLADVEAYFPDYPYPNLLRALEASVLCLTPELRNRYLEVAVFPHDVEIPESALRALWSSAEFDDDRTEKARSELVQRALLQRDANTRLLSLHYLQLQYLKAQHNDDQQRALHEKILTGYEALCDDREGWASGPDDGYFFEHLAYHLCQAGQKKVLHDLLLSHSWIAAKLNATNVAQLLGDFDLYFQIDADAPDLRLVAETIRLSADVLVIEPAQLAAQLLGRLLGKTKLPGVRELLEQAKNACRVPALIPLKCNLTPPGGPLIRTLRGHNGGVNSVSTPIAPADASFQRMPLAISASEDGTLRVWDLERGCERQVLSRRNDPVIAVAMTADGTTAVSGSKDNTLTVWDISTGAVRHTLKGHSGWVRAVAVTLDGRLAVSGSSDNTLRVWDLVKGTELRTLTGHSGPVVHVSISPDGKTCFSACHDWTAKVWNLESGELIQTLSGHQDRCVWAAAVSPDGKTVATGCADNLLRVWHWKNGGEPRILRGHTGPVYSVAIVPGGKHVVSGSEDQTVQVWDLETGDWLGTFRGHSGPVVSVAISPDGQTVISASGDTTSTVGDRTIKVWRLANLGGQSEPLTHRGAVRSLAMTRDQKVIVSGSEDTTLKVWDLPSNHVVGTMTRHRDAVTAVVVTSDGKTAISASNDSTLMVWNLRDFSWRATLGGQQGHQAAVTSVAVTPDGKTVVSGSTDRTLIVWDLESGRPLTKFYADAPILTCAISPDGETVVAGDFQETVHFLRLQLDNSKAPIEKVRSHRAKR